MKISSHLHYSRFLKLSKERAIAKPIEIKRQRAAKKGVNKIDKYGRLNHQVLRRYIANKPKKIRTNKIHIRKNNSSKAERKQYSSSLEEFQEKIWKVQQRIITKYCSYSQFQKVTSFIEIAQSLSRSSRRQNNLQSQKLRIISLQKKCKQVLPYIRAVYGLQLKVDLTKRGGEDMSKIEKYFRIKDEMFKSKIFPNNDGKQEANGQIQQQKYASQVIGVRKSQMPDQIQSPQQSHSGSQQKSASKISSQFDTPKENSNEHHKKITKDNLKFCQKSQKYDVFKKLVMKNVCFTFAYLSSKNIKNNYIIQCKDAKKWKDKYFENGFYVITKRGDRSIMGTDQSIIIEAIWKKGREYIYSWITSIACAIAEMEAMGLFHCDIEFRNTVLLENIFKLIDFDYIFKIKKVENSDVKIINGLDYERQAYENTMQMIQQLLKIGRLQKDDNMLSFLFPQIGKLTQKYWSEFDYDNQMQNILRRTINDKYQANVLIREMEAYSIKSHRYQFQRLVKSLLNQKIFEIYANIMSRKQINMIYFWLEELCLKQISYEKFAKEVNIIKFQHLEDRK